MMRKRWKVVHIMQATPYTKLRITKAVTTVTRMGARRLAHDLNYSAIMQGATHKYYIFLYTVRRMDP